jgi:crossover junction endodeoxyribonuclease RuvC
VNEQRDPSLNEWDRIIIGIDPGTNVMGYGILGVKKGKPAMIAMGVVKLNKFDSHYKRLGHIFNRITGIIEHYLPDEMAIEAPFFGKNVQSMLKLGRVQGVAMAAAINHDISVTEYEPRKIKLAITGNGAAAKEQVQEMLKRILNIPQESILRELDATDALGAALCHFYESGKPAVAKGPGSWKEFIAKNPDRLR